MAFRINNPFKSPLYNEDPAMQIIENNKRINADRQRQRLEFRDEEQHVADARNNVQNVVTTPNLQEQNLKYQDTLAATIDPKGVIQGLDYDPSRTDILGGKLVPKTTFDWLENIEGNATDDTGMSSGSRLGCNSYACAIGGAAGMRVPQNEKGGINIYQESANGGKGGYTWYASGDPMPVIPWNKRFDENAQALGFELQPKGTLPDQGDFIRVGYDAPRYNYNETTGEYEDATPEFGSTGHSAIATESLAEGGKSVYNPGNIYAGVKSNDYYLKDEEFTDGVDRVQRYVGSLPYLEKKWNEYSQNEDNKLKSWFDPSTLEESISMPDPKESIADIKMPIRYTPEEMKKLKRKNKRNK